MISASWGQEERERRGGRERERERREREREREKMQETCKLLLYEENPGWRRREAGSCVRG